MADNGYNTPLTLDIKENEPLNVSLFNFDTKVTQHIEISKISPILKTTPMNIVYKF